MNQFLPPNWRRYCTYQLFIELLRALFLDGEDKPPRLKREDAQGNTLNELANAYALSGQPRRAVPLFEGYISISENKDYKINVAVGLVNVAGMAQIHIGALSEAERNLRRQIKMKVDEFDVAVGYQNLGHVLLYCGAWQEAEQELDKSLEVAEKQTQTQMQGVIWAYRALRFLLMVRESAISNQSPVNSVKSAIECAKRALELADEQAKDYPVPRDYIRAHWLLGAAYCASVVLIRRRWSSNPQDVSRPAAYSTTELESLTLAEENLSKALHLCRQINMVDHEADILLDLARLRYAQGDFKDAQEKASEALVITERSGYVLQGADVHLFLAELALEGYRLEGLNVESDKEAAIHHAKEALRLAYCDDGPPYYYKVAYEEAERMLEKL